MFLHGQLFCHLRGSDNEAAFFEKAGLVLHCFVNLVAQARHREAVTLFVHRLDALLFSHFAFESELTLCLPIMLHKRRLASQLLIDAATFSMCPLLVGLLGWPLFLLGVGSLQLFAALGPVGFVQVVVADVATR